MTLVPGPGPHDVGAELRGAARRQARGWAGAGPALFAVAITAVLMTALIALDYRYDQDPHRIVKVAIGLLTVGGVLSQPRFGLMLLPVVSPFLTWVPPLPIPGLNALNVILLGVFGSFAIGEVMAHRSFLRRGRLGNPIFVLLGISALSIIRAALVPTGYAYAPVEMAIGLLRSTTIFLAYFMVLAMARGESDRRRITWAVLAGLLAESVTVVLLGRNGPSQRAVGSIGQANELGAYLAMFTVVAIALALGARSLFARACAAAIALAGCYATLLSVSRGAILAVLVGAGFAVWRTSRAAFLVMLVVLAASPFWLPDYVMERITSTRTETDDGVSVDTAAQIRLSTWQATMGVITKYPLVGVGFGGLGAVLPDMGSAMGLAEIRDSSHNTYLRMQAELGFFGFAAYVYMLWKMFWLGVEGAKRAKRRFDRSAAVGLSGAVLVMVISCAFGDRFWSPVVVSSLWIMSGVVDDSLQHPAPEAAA